jgi:uncharacterized membrane-anchored protein
LNSSLETKVPQVTLGFWIIKIAATTLGETGGDAVTMSMNLGYLAGTGIFVALLAALLAAQLAARRFHPYLFWAVIVATTTTGTTLADLADRSLGLGYTGGSLLLLALLLLSFALWYRSQGTVGVASVTSWRAEAFYWVTILFSQTLGTALGDWAADSGGLGFAGGSVTFGTAIVLLAAAYFWTRLPRTLLFWAAFVLTRPFGATLGDLLDKPHAQGGFELSRYIASAVLLILILVLVTVLPQRAAGAASATPQQPVSPAG